MGQKKKTSKKERSMNDLVTSPVENIAQNESIFDDDYGTPLLSFGDNKSKNTAGTDVTTHYALNPDLLEPIVKEALDKRFKKDKYFRDEVTIIRNRKSELLFSESSII